MGVLNGSFFTMNYFAYACIEREGGRVCNKMYVCVVTWREGQKFLIFFAYAINE